MDLEALERETEELHKSVYGKEEAPEEIIDSEDELEEQPEDEAPPKQDDFEQKYRVLQGKYTAELERMNSLLSSTLSERERLAAELDNIKSSKRLEEEPNFEDDLEVLQSEYPTIAKGVKALLSKELSARIAKTEGMVSNLAETTSRVVEDKYISGLDSKVPYWRQVKDDERFAKWLAANDRYTGQPRYNLLVGADRSRNVDLVAAFYEDFAREAGMVGNESDASQSNPSAATRTKSQNYNQPISPSTVGNPAPSTASKGFITRAEISQFYRDRALGKYNGTEEDAAKMEGRIMKAVREGKVR